MTKNCNNELPIYKIGQILTWQEESNHKGFKGIVDVSGVVKEIHIKKEHLHQIALRPSIYYTLISTADNIHTWEIEQFYLRRYNPKISKGYATDDQLFINQKGDSSDE